MTSSTPTLPVLDLDAPPDEAARQFREACEDHGFLYLVNHGVAAETVAAAFAANRDFHELTLDEKLEVRLNRHFRGYQPIGGSTLKVTTVEPAQHPNQSESFFVRHLSPSSTNGRCPIDGPNQWPARPADFKVGVETYLVAMETLGSRLVTLAAQSLGEDPTAFGRRYFSRPSTALRLLHYPPAGQGPADAYGIAPHTDYGFLTILAQDDSGGLEIRSPAGDSWQAVRPMAGSFVLNIGNALSLMTNDRFVSTAHRVNNPSGEHSRYSVAVFFDPCLDADVEVLAGFKNGAASLPPMNFGDYFASRLAANYDHS